MHTEQRTEWNKTCDVTQWQKLTAALAGQLATEALDFK